MRLVGATRWYTQLPFLIEAVVAGVVGAVLAVGRAARRRSSCSSTSCWPGIVSNGVVPPIEVADIVWVAPILVMVGAGDRRPVTGYVTLRLYVRLVSAAPCPRRLDR